MVDRTDPQLQLRVVNTRPQSIAQFVSARVNYTRPNPFAVQTLNSGQVLILGPISILKTGLHILDLHLETVHIAPSEKFQFRVVFACQSLCSTEKDWV